MLFSTFFFIRWARLKICHQSCYLFIRNYTREESHLEIPSYHKKPSAPTNLTLNQAIAINEPRGCGDVAVFPGDYIVGDDDGIMVIPKHLAEEVAEECLKMTEYENFVLQKVSEGTLIGLYPMTDDNYLKEFKRWKKWLIVLILINKKASSNELALSRGGRLKLHILPLWFSIFYLANLQLYTSLHFIS